MGKRLHSGRPRLGVFGSAAGRRTCSQKPSFTFENKSFANILPPDKLHAMLDRQALLNRFLRYVQIESMAVADAGRYPSSDGQLEVGRLLVAELSELGLQATQDDHGIVVCTLPGNVPDAPVVALNAHVDTSPETSATNVKPNVIEHYLGGDIPLPGSNRSIRLEENPELESLVGKTLVTTDGTTLLGADDKAGVAIIMQVVQTLIEQSEIPHGDVRILFTCDEEIGLGVKHVDVPALKADVCYTLDGGGAGDIDTETFSADAATVTIHGVNIHPSIAKDRMVNSVRVMAEFLVRLPQDTLSPESTEGRQGFLHPYEFHLGVDDHLVAHHPRAGLDRLEAVVGENVDARPTGRAPCLDPQRCRALLAAHDRRRPREEQGVVGGLDDVGRVRTGVGQREGTARIGLALEHLAGQIAAVRRLREHRDPLPRLPREAIHHRSGHGRARATGTEEQEGREGGAGRHGGSGSAGGGNRSRPGGTGAQMCPRLRHGADLFRPTPCTPTSYRRRANVCQAIVTHTGESAADVPAPRRVMPPPRHRGFQAAS